MIMGGLLTLWGEQSSHDHEAMARGGRRKVRDGLEGRTGTAGRGYWAATGAERLRGDGGTRCEAAEEPGDANPGLGLAGADPGQDRGDGRVGIPHQAEQDVLTVADAVTSRSSGLAVGSPAGRSG
jgi:hypothetical protein